MTQNLVIFQFSEQRYMILNLCTFLGHPVEFENSLLDSWLQGSFEKSSKRPQRNVNNGLKSPGAPSVNYVQYNLRV